VDESVVVDTACHPLLDAGNELGSTVFEEGVVAGMKA